MRRERFEELYEKSYKPFLKLLNSNTDVYAVLYYSGILLEHLEEYHPEFVMLLHDLVRRKQVELVGGAYYEPFLPLIPNSDKLGQIEYLTTYLRRRFGTRVRGCWIPYGVWDPILPFTLRNSGMEYAFLKAAGLENGGGPFVPSITEEYGKSLVIYPVYSSYMGNIMTETPDGFLGNHIKEMAATPGSVLPLVLNGDAFISGDTDWKEQEKWISDFFLCVRENRNRIEYMQPGRSGRIEAPLKKAYYGPTRYGELMEWRGEPYSRDDSVFKKTLLEYPESNTLYSKMMYVYQLVNQIRGDKSRKKTAREELWKGQDNSVFWFGHDGGVYRNNYRKAAFSALLEAEKLTRERGIFKSSVVALDIDLDGREEYLYQGNTINAYITSVGAQLFELDYLPNSWNYLDTLAVRNSKGEYYPYLRRAFIDHLIQKGNTLEQFESNTYTEMNPEINKVYELKDLDREKMGLVFETSGSIAGVSSAFTMKKSFQFKRNSLGIHYEICSEEIGKETPVFASEINLSLPEPPGDRVRVFAVSKGERTPLLNDKAIARQASELVIEDSINGNCITLTSSKLFRLWMFQIYTSFQTASGVMTEYQSTCFIPAWTQAMGASKTWDVSVTLRMDKMGKSK